jgi:2-haloacid dehalogenase
VRPYDAVIFDLGGVVLGWDPALAFADVLAADQVAAFLTKIDFSTWNHAHDAGRRFEEGEAELVARFPADAAAIQAYRKNFDRTLTGQVPGTGAIIAELAGAGLRLVALTNWSDETFPHAQSRFGILRRFEGVVVSGAEGVAKPDPGIFALACDRHQLEPFRTVFVDDVARNVSAAAAAGLTAIEFRDAEQLRTELFALGVLGPSSVLEEPVYHLAVATEWAAGAYPWSTRGVTYDAEGYVHCSFASQLAGARKDHFGDLPDDDLVVIELDDSSVPALVVVEDVGAGVSMPHLYAPLEDRLVYAVRPYPQT